MAFQVAFPVPDSLRKTDPLIQCIIYNNVNKLCKLLKGRDVNGLYPSEVWKDDVPLLTAAVICRNEEICSFLLEKSADPNKQSTNGRTPLHYAAFTPGVPLNIVKRLLAAKANPNENGPQTYTLFQKAVHSVREDVVKALIEAGASPEINHGLNPDYDKKLEAILARFSLQSKEFEKVHLFYSLSGAVRTKQQAEVFRTYEKHFLIEHPFIGVILLESYCGVGGPYADHYRYSAIEWLKDKKKADGYIEGIVKRFPKISQEHWKNVLSCINAALFVSESVSLYVFGELVSILTKSLQHFDKKGEIINHLILQILSAMMRKTSEQNLRLDRSVYKELCGSLLPLTHPTYSSRIRTVTYGVFAYLNDFVPEVVASCRLAPIPNVVLLKANTEMDGIMNKKLQSLGNLKGSRALDGLYEENAALSTRRKKENKKKVQKALGSQEAKLGNTEEPVETSIGESNSAVNRRRWHKTSIRWRPKLEKLANMDANKTYRLQSLTLANDDEFRIAKGSEGTEVFLGLRDDGTEVAVKRMNKSNYKELRNEEQFLRLPQLDSPSIVRYVDFAVDDHFGYLALQLCEYTLEEYIQDHLPEDSGERSLVLKKLVKEVLHSLQVLHHPQTKVLHRDIKPQNVLIDISGKARLSDFGISRRLEQNETTLQTGMAGTRCWKAKETIGEEVNARYKRSSDIQVAGMLVYYILSSGQHPFGKQPFCEVNILRGRYSLEHLDDDVAKDLVEWMIQENPNDRPTVEQTLAHPFFWADERRVEYLKNIGNLNEVQNCRNLDQEFIHAVEEFTEGKLFSEWKNKLPPEIVQKLDGKKKGYPENTLGLLRFIRNLHEHYPEDAEKINLVDLFPDLFGSVFRFAKEKGWHSRASLKKLFNAIP